MNISIEITHDGETKYFDGDDWVTAWKDIKDAGDYAGDLTMAALGEKTHNGADGLNDHLNPQRRGRAQ